MKEVVIVNFEKDDDFFNMLRDKKIQKDMEKNQDKYKAEEKRLYILDPTITQANDIPKDNIAIREYNFKYDHRFNNMDRKADVEIKLHIGNHTHKVTIKTSEIHTQCPVQYTKALMDIIKKSVLDVVQNEFDPYVCSQPLF